MKRAANPGDFLSLQPVLDRINEANELRTFKLDQAPMWVEVELSQITNIIVMPIKTADDLIALVAVTVEESNGVKVFKGSALKVFDKGGRTVNALAFQRVNALVSVSFQAAQPPSLFN